MDEESPQEKQRRYNEAYETRQREKGLVPVRVWVPSGKVHLLREYAEQLRIKK